jgi:hypothetical protein
LNPTFLVHVNARQLETDDEAIAEVDIVTVDDGGEAHALTGDLKIAIESQSIFMHNHRPYAFPAL